MTAGKDAAAKQTRYITLGAGCFWCTEAVFRRVAGVEGVEVGYMGGNTPNPSYRQVCSGSTGHAEVARIAYDGTPAALKRILDAFWRTHDATQQDRQGADIGTQYRSAIFYSTEAQRRVAEESKAAHQANTRGRVVTEITQASTFYAAEGYHQDYFRKNPGASYCQMIIRPKLRKLEEKH